VTKSRTNGGDHSPATQSRANGVDPLLGKKSNANGVNHSLATQSFANGSDHSLPTPSGANGVDISLSTQSRANEVGHSVATQSCANEVDRSLATRPRANGVGLHGNETFQPTRGPRNIVYPSMTYINSSSVQVIRTLESQIPAVSYQAAQFPRTTLPSTPHQTVQTLPSQLRQVTNFEDLSAFPHVDITNNSNHYNNQASQISEAEQRETIRNLSIMLGARQQQEQQGVRHESWDDGGVGGNGGSPEGHTDHTGGDL
jgi:hypothetical protein